MTAIFVAANRCLGEAIPEDRFIYTGDALEVASGFTKAIRPVAMCKAGPFYDPHLGPHPSVGGGRRSKMTITSSQ